MAGKPGSAAVVVGYGGRRGMAVGTPPAGSGGEITGGSETWRGRSSSTAVVVCRVATANSARATAATYMRQSPVEGGK